MQLAGLPFWIKALVPLIAVGGVACQSGGQDDDGLRAGLCAVTHRLVFGLAAPSLTPGTPWAVTCPRPWRSPRMEGRLSRVGRRPSQ